MDDAWQVLRSNGPTAARLLATRAEALDPLHARSSFLLGLSWAAEGKLRHAIEAYKRSVKLDPTNADALTNLGFSLAIVGRRKEAIEALSAAVRYAPDSQLARNDLAWAKSLPR